MSQNNDLPVYSNYIRPKTGNLFKKGFTQHIFYCAGHPEYIRDNYDVHPVAVGKITKPDEAPFCLTEHHAVLQLFLCTHA